MPLTVDPITDPGADAGLPDDMKTATGHRPAHAALHPHTLPRPGIGPPPGSGLPKATPTLDALMEHASLGRPSPDAALPRPGPALALALLMLTQRPLADPSASESLLREFAPDAPPETLRHAGEELARAQTHHQQRPDGGPDWRTATLPFLADGGTVPLHMRWRGSWSRHRARENEPGLRFAVQVTFSRLGAIEIDGLLRRRRMDVQVRMATPLPEHLESTLARSFHDELEAAGFAGSLAISAGGARAQA